MTTPPPAKLAYLTSPEKGTAIINLVVDGEPAQAFVLSRDQLFNLNAQTADLLVKEYK